MTNNDDLKIKQLEQEIEGLESMLYSKDKEIERLNLDFNSLSAKYDSLESDFNYKVFKDAFRFNSNFRDRQLVLKQEFERLEKLLKDLGQDIATSEQKIMGFLENIIGREEEDQDMIDERVLRFLDQMERI